jgi:hypothetical protein
MDNSGRSERLHSGAWATPMCRSLPSGLADKAGLSERGKAGFERLALRDCCKIPYAQRFSSSRIMLIWIIAALLAVNLS